MLSKKQVQMTLGTMTRCNQEHSWIGYRCKKKKIKKFLDWLVCVENMFSQNL